MTNAPGTRCAYATGGSSWPPKVSAGSSARAVSPESTEMRNGDASQGFLMFGFSSRHSREKQWLKNGKNAMSHLEFLKPKQCYEIAHNMVGPRSAFDSFPMCQMAVGSVQMLRLGWTAPLPLAPAKKRVSTHRGLNSYSVH